MSPVSSPAVKGFHLYLIETVNLATKVPPRVVRVERRALISDQAGCCSRLRSSYGLDSELRPSSQHVSLPFISDSPPRCWAARTTCVSATARILLQNFELVVTKILNEYVRNNLEIVSCFFGEQENCVPSMNAFVAFECGELSFDSGERQ